MDGPVGNRSIISGRSRYTIRMRLRIVGFITARGVQGFLPLMYLCDHIILLTLHDMVLISMKPNHHTEHAMSNDCVMSTEGI